MCIRDSHKEVNPIADYMTAGMELPAYLPYPRFLLETDLSHTARELYAVSYTHLLKQFYAARRKLTGEFPDGKVDMKKLSDEYDELEPVSYTHLDVYKRQMQRA